MKTALVGRFRKGLRVHLVATPYDSTGKEAKRKADWPWCGAVIHPRRRGLTSWQGKLSEVTCERCKRG